MESPFYTKDQIILIVAKFAKSISADWLDNSTGGTLEETVEEVKDLIDWDIVPAKETVPKNYIEKRECDHCEKKTYHKIIEYGHERDSSMDSFECMECHWYGFGVFGKYHPPATEE